VNENEESRFSSDVRMLFQMSSRRFPLILLVVVMAPAFTKGVHFRSFVLFDRDDRIEGLTGRVYADVLFDRGRTLLLQSERKGENLRYRLNRDFRLHVAARENPAVGRDEGNPKLPELTFARAGM
jgi:hypothetical protein